MIRKFLVALAFAVSGLVSVQVQAEAVTSEEYQAVIDTAYSYFKGVTTADRTLMERAFDLEYGHLKWVKKDDETDEEIVRVVPLEEFAAYFKEAQTETWKAKILSVDIVDDRMAMVKLDFDTPKVHYIDYLVMYKREAGWRIINKTFVANDK